MENIKARQNEPWMLRIQYAAKYHFNRAEKIGHWIWIAALLAELCIFLPESTPDLLKWGCPVSFLIIELLISDSFKNHIKTASSLRNFFDSYVLNLKYNEYSSNQIEEFEEEALRVFDKKVDAATTQISNTGRDFPPGVKDWYEFPKQYLDNDAIFECQKQNKYWNHVLSKKRRYLYFSIMIISLLPLLIVGLWGNHGLRWSMLMCVSGLVLRGIDRICAHISYARISHEIDSIVDNLSKDHKYSNLLDLQSKIDTRRTLPVLESDAIHKKLAAKISTTYERITRHT